MKRRKPRPSPRVARAPTGLPVLLILLLLAALAVRLYFFALTRGQPVWWDEAEYLIKARHIALGTPETGYFTGRPILLPVFMSGFFALGLGETAIRLALVPLSLATVYLTYRVGRRLHGEVAGLAAALLYSAFYIPLFYSTRIMTEIPQLALALLAVDLFLARTPARTALSVPVLALGALTRFPTAILLPILLVSAPGRLRERALWLSFAIAALAGLPYLLWADLTYGDPLEAWHASQYLMPHLGIGERLAGVGFYLDWIRSSLGWVLTGLVVVGLVVGARRAPLVVVWALGPVLYFGLFVRPLEDRFIILALPPLFIAVGHALTWLAELGARRQRRLQAALVLTAALIASVPLLQYGNTLIRAKASSFAALRDAGLWLRRSSPPGTTLMSPSVAQLTYYAERPTLPIPKTQADFDRALHDGRARYVVVSHAEPNPGWMPSASPEALGLRLAAGFPEDQPEAAVFTYDGLDAAPRR